MRIIAGEWRRRQLRAPPGEATRPTADRVRETMFAMLASRLGSFENLAVADLFAGSGALGLEALSRGAASCLFVEEAPAAVAVLKENIAVLGAGSRAIVRAQSALRLGPADAPFDLVLIDPPYQTNLGVIALDRLARLGWFGPASWIVLETARDDEPDIRVFALDTQRVVGPSRLSFYRMTSLN